MSNESEIVFELNSSISSTNDAIPIKLDWFQTTCHVLLVSTGIPLNMIIVVVITIFKRLNNKPRIILWLGVTYCNLLTLLTILVEFLAYHTQNTTVCFVFISITGVAYTCLLFNLFLALLDRYVAIVYPLFHREKVTVRRVIIGQLLSFVFFVILIKFPFITRLAPLRCSICPIHGKIIATTNMILLLMCIIAQIVVFNKTRQYFPRKQDGSNEASVSFVQITRQRQVCTRHENVEAAVVISNSSTSERPPTDQHPAGGLLMKRHGGNRRMEVEATWSLLAGVFSLLVFTFPTLLLGFIGWGCRLLYGDQCSHVDQMALHARELLLSHLVYNPVMYMMRSHEFSSTLREKICITKQQSIVNRDHSRHSNERQRIL